MNNEIMTMINDETMKPYTTLDTTTPEGLSAVFKAMNQADESMKSMVNQAITVKDVFAQKTQVVDEKTGEVRDAVKIVLFDTEGVSYGTNSIGIYRAMCSLISLIGSPETWVSPVTIKVTSTKVAKGDMVGFDVIDWGDNKPIL